MNNKCPKCNFNLIDSNCPKCGYDSNHIYLEKYKTMPNDLELLLKDDYSKIVHNKNRMLIILLGPLYFSYYKVFIPAIIFTIIEIYIHYIMSLNLMTGGTLSTILLILLFLIDFIFLRIIYLAFFNPLLLTLLKHKLTKIKKEDNYKELIYKYEPKSILRPIIFILITILLIIIKN